MQRPRRYLFLLLFVVTNPFANAILQTAQLVMTKNDGTGETLTLLASQASFGLQHLDYYDSSHDKSSLPLNRHVLFHTSFDLCTNDTTTIMTTGTTIPLGAILVAPRGTCTFQRKAMTAQQLGASGLVIYGTLKSRYSINSTTADSMIYPQDKIDYDCTKGSADIDIHALTFNDDHTYSESNDVVLSGSTMTNLCLKHSSDQLANCPSKACLLTGNYSKNKQQAQVCCAWDLPIWLYSDPTFNDTMTAIPIIYITMEQAHLVLTRLYDDTSIDWTAVIYSRWRPKYNTSGILLWALGVLVATIAAWSSASDYKRAISGELARRSTRTTTATTASTMRTGPTLQQQQQQEEQLELSAEHAIGFIVMASSGLFILFFFKIYSVVKIMYAFGCSRALMQVIFDPLWTRILSKNKVIYATGTIDFGDITLVDVLAFVSGYTWGIVWLIVAMTVRHAEQNVFFWVTQDIMGACMCIMFLSIIKINSMRVASILLLVAFFYDIFFVFITPLLFKGESVMITVATSGGPPKADPSWCEKYPDDVNCQGGDPLPMLLTMPRFFDYQGGSSLLGLGDIVLPGLLLSFAARLDAAKELLGVLRGGGGGTMMTGGGRYFWPLVASYGIGLAMANFAVYWMNMGQPALLYLVPCCLGTMGVLGYSKGELAGLWHGPKAVVTADSILYGGSTITEGGAMQPLPTEDDLADEAPVPQSALDIA